MYCMYNPSLLYNIDQRQKVLILSHWNPYFSIVYLFCTGCSSFIAGKHIVCTFEFVICQSNRKESDCSCISVPQDGPSELKLEASLKTLASRSERGIGGWLCKCIIIILQWSRMFMTAADWDCTWPRIFVRSMVASCNSSLALKQVRWLKFLEIEKISCVAFGLTQKLFVFLVIKGQHPPLPGGLKDVAMETLYVEPDCTNAWIEPLTILDVNHHSHFMESHQVRFPRFYHYIAKAYYRTSCFKPDIIDTISWFCT